MPTGKVRFFDADRGFGFIAGDDGAADHPNPRVGARVEYSVADGRKGPQALSVRFLKETASVARAKRRKPQAMVPVVEDLIKLLDSSSAALRRGSYPDNATKIAKVLRAVAEEFDA